MHATVETVCSQLRLKSALPIPGEHRGTNAYNVIHKAISDEVRAACLERDRVIIDLKSSIRMHRRMASSLGEEFEPHNASLYRALED